MDHTVLVRRFWRWALLVPVLGALAATRIPDDQGVFLVIGSLIIAVPYAGFAAVMWWLFGRLSSGRMIVTAALLSPLALAAPILGIVVWGTIAAGVFAQRPDAGMLVAVFVPWTLAFGYAYVLPLALVYGVVWLIASLVWLRQPRVPRPNHGLQADNAPPAR